MNTTTFKRQDTSGAIQNASTWLNRARNELEDARNVRFNETIGASVRRNGYEKSGQKFSTTNKPPVGAHTAQFTTGPKKLVACHNDAETFTIVRVQELAGTWTTIISDLPTNVEVFFCDFGDEVFVSGFDKTTNIPFQPRNINSLLDVSLTRNLLFAPWAKYYVVFKGVLYATNVRVNDQVFPDRLYKASPRTGAFAFVRGAQTDKYITPTLVNQVPAMTSNTTPSGVSAASNEANPTFLAWKAFDRDSTSTEWSTSGTSGIGWLSYDFGSGNAKVITYYSVLGRPTTEPNTTVQPKDWTFEGSNNGSSWTSIDSRTAAPVWGAGELRTYSAANTTAYRYYRINVSANWGSSNLAIGELAMYTSLQGIKAMQLDLNTVRYAKPGMVIDIYKSGKPTKLYTLTIYDVDKANDQIQFLPLTRTDPTADNTTETINFPTDLSLTDFPTGTPVKFYTVGTMPGGMTADTTYYVIRIPGDDNSIKLAATQNDALIGSNILLSSNGSGQLTIALSYVFGNNDEIYLSGRYNVLSTLWNTDYPTADQADWTAVQPAVDSNNSITAVIESTNRLMIYTQNTSSRWDGSTPAPIAFNKRVGCVSQRAIQSIDDEWVVWLSARGRIYARNEGSGQQQYISRAIYNKLLSKITLAQLLKAVSGLNDDKFALYLGLYDGRPTRVIYDFGSNTWAVDTTAHPTLMYINDSSSGFIKPYFVSDNGYLYMDDSGYTDDDLAIEFDMKYGKTHYGTELLKEFIGAFIYSQDANGLKIMISIDGGKYLTVGEVTGTAQQIMYRLDNNRPIPQGVCVDVRLNGQTTGPPQVVEAFYDFFNLAQTVAGQGNVPE
jgi:hypothetical protein